MRENTLSGIATVIIVIILVISAGPVLVTKVSAADKIQDPTGNLPNDQLFEGTSDGQIEVWDRSAYTLRTDDTDASTAVSYPSVLQGQKLGSGNSFTNSNDGTDSRDLIASFGTEQNNAGVHSSGSISISFDDGRASSTALSNQGRVDFIAAKITGGKGTGFSDSYSDAVTLYGSVENANENLTFESMRTSKTLSSTGTYDFSYNFDPGQWIIYAVVHENNKNGFEVSNGDVSVDGDVAIVGVDTVSVHEAPASVTEPSNPSPGDTLNFGIDTTNAFSSSKDGQITHTVAVYKKSTYDESRLDLVFDQSQFGPNFNIRDDSELEHSIANTIGIADVEDGIEINGVDLSDGRVARSVGLGAIVDQLSEDFGTADPTTDVIPQGGSSNSATEEIYASVRAVTGQNRDATVSVETFSNFSEGTYQYVVFSKLDNDATTFSTASGTIDISTETQPTNSPPDATDDSYTVDEDSTLSESSPGVLSNDDDPEGDTLTPSVNNGPTNGTLTLNNDGSFTYTPDANFSGQDSFTYTVSDGNGNSDSATVTITVEGTNDPPIADAGANQSVVENETVQLSGVGSTDVDPGDALSYSWQITSGPGSLNSTNSQNVTYIAPSNITGLTSATVELTVTDNASATDTDTVTIQVTEEDLPAVALNRSQILFGSVPASPNAANQAIGALEITNSGTASLQLGSFDISGVGAGQFTIVDGAGTTSLAPGETHTVAVRFAPSERGTTTATLEFATNAPTGTQQISLNGTGGGPTVAVPATLAFGDRSSNVTQTFDIQNTGDTPMAVTSLSGLDSPFVVQGDPTGVIAPGSAQPVTVAFNATGASPGVVGDRLTIETNDSFNPTVDIAISGTVSRPVLRVSPESTLAFGDIPRGQAQTRALVVSNKGTQEMTLTGVSVPDGFTTSASPPITIPPGESTRIDVTFTNPTTDLTAADEITITTSSAGTASVDLTANILNPELANPNRELDFGPVPNGSTVSTGVTIENTGDANLTIDAAGVFNEPFSLGRSSPTVTVPAGTSKTLFVRFTPTSPTSFNQKLILPTNDPDSDLALTASGSGITTNLTATPTTLSFTAGRNETVTQTVSIENTGQQSISSLTAELSSAGPYTIVNTPTAIGPGETRPVTVRFDPPAAGTFVRTLEVSGGESTTVVTLDGEALSPKPRLARQTLSLGYAAVGGSSTRTLELTNEGPAGTTVTANIGAATFDDAQFSLGANAPDRVSLASGERATIPITFQPDAAGPQQGTISIPTNDQDRRTLTAGLTGVGSAPNVTVKEPASGTLTFDTTPIGTQSAPQVVTLTNAGGVPVEISDISTSDDAFTIVGGQTSTTLVPGEETRVSVTAQPQNSDITSGSSQKLSASLSITANDTDSPETVSLAANATKPTVKSTSVAAFGDTGVGSASLQQFSITNVGDAVLELDAPSLSGADTDDFSVVTGDNATRLPPGEQTVFSVAYTPGTAEADNATLQITTNDPETQTVERSLSGTGVTADVQLSDASLGFGRVSVGQTAQSTIDISNTGGTDATISSVSIEGADANAFQQETAVSGSTIAANGGSKQLTVSVTPLTRNSLNAQLVIDVTSESGNTTVTAALGATGVEPELSVSPSATFDQTRLGAQSTKTITIDNTGNAPLRIESANIASGDTEKFRIRNAPDVIGAKSSGTITVTFAPGDFTSAIPSQAVSDAKTGTAQTATLDITTSAGDESISLSGTGKTPELTRSSSSLQFGSVAIGATARDTIELRNDIAASADVTLEDVSLFGSSAYTITNNDAIEGTTLSPGDEVTVNVSLTPETPGTKTAVLGVVTNDPRQPATSVFLGNTRTVVGIDIGSVNASYQDVEAGDQPAIEFDRGLDTNASIRGFQPNVSTTNDFSLRTEGFDTATDNPVEAADDTADLDPFRYVNATTTVTNENVNENAFRFRVSKAALADRGLARDEVTLYQYNDTTNKYDSLSTEQVDSTRTAHIYEATATGFSSFAIAESQPDQPAPGSPLPGIPAQFDTDLNGAIDITELGRAGSAYVQDEISITELGDIASIYVQTPKDQLSGTPAQFDADSNGAIDITELGDAGSAYIRGDINITQLGEVASVYVQS